MLSPNAMNFVTASCAGRVTVTGNPHVAVWLAAALAAEQPTDVVPTGNIEPEACVQDVWMGGVPPWVVGDGHETATGWPVVDTAVWAGGQVIVSWAGGGDGSVGDPPHPAADAAASTVRIHGPTRHHWRILAMITQRFSAPQRRRHERLGPRQVRRPRLPRLTAASTPGIP
jgi:hypothetical protein